MIRPATRSDAAAIAQIYNHYIEQTVVTFEEESLSPARMGKRIELTSSAWPYLVYEEEGEVLGYAYAGQWHPRRSYRLSSESTVYLHHEHLGRGIGGRLYRALLEELRQRSIHTVIGGIALPNEASIALHKRLGFERAALYREVGRKFERWIDVAYYQLML